MSDEMIFFLFVNRVENVGNQVTEIQITEIQVKDIEIKDIEIKEIQVANSNPDSTHPVRWKWIVTL